MNKSLNRAKSKKNDEFYTLYNDIVKELRNYDFNNMIIYCNCDTINSSFFQFFYANFFELGIKKLICTCLGGYKIEFNGHSLSKSLLADGDFRSIECLNILKEADCVVTNPPFSLFREFVSSIMRYDKKFLIIGNMNAIKYKEIFPLIMYNKMWLGVNYVHSFIQPNGEIKKFGNINWYTNLDNHKRHQMVDLCKLYNSKDYPKYDTYDAIECSKVSDIPKDYEGIIGVPISFLSKYNPKQFEIVGEFNHGSDNKFDLAKPIIKGKELYPRIAIKITPT